MMKRNKYPAAIILLVVTLVLLSCAGTAAPQQQQPSKQADATNSQEVDNSTIVVPPPPPKASLPVIQFTVNPGTITSGGSATLSWTVINATSVQIDHGVGSVQLTGTRSVSPTVPTTYKLSAANASGAAVKTVSIVVNAGTAPAATPPKTTK